MIYPELKLSYRWISEHEQEMERINPWPPGRTLYEHEKKPIEGPILLVGFVFTAPDGKKYGETIMRPYPSSIMLNRGE